LNGSREPVTFWGRPETSSEQMGFVMYDARQPKSDVALDKKLIICRRRLIRSFLSHY